MKRALSIFMFVLLLVSMLTLAFSIQPVRASGTIYIRADGSIDPPTAPISTFDNITYTFTGNINSFGDGIVVEKDSIVLDGAGCTLQGTEAYESKGIDLSGRSNVTIKNMEIKTFVRGIWLHSSSDNSISGNNITNNWIGIDLYSSSNNTVYGNNITANNYGIQLYYSSNYNSISGNAFAGDGLVVWVSYQSSVENNTVNGRPLVYLEGVANCTVDDAGQVILVRCENMRVEGLNLSRTSVGIELWETSNSSISGNNITNNVFGIHLDSSSSSSISGNNITNNDYGIWLFSSSNNKLFHNSFVNNNIQAYSIGSANTWDNGYPSGGNYWSDYAGVDLYSGLYQNVTGSDGIGDTPYVIDLGNQDNYPLMNSWPSGWKLDFTPPTNHPIVDFAVYNGSLYAASDNKLYTYDQNSWDIIDAPTFMTSLEPYGGKLVVGGEGGLYYYDGASFGLIFSVPTYIKALGAYNNTLYAGTFLDKPPILCYCNGNADNPDNWHIDISFSAILNFSGPFGSVDSFAEYDGNLYVTSGGNIYSYNETGWNAVKTFDDVYGFSCMQVYNDKLYLATRDQGWRKPLYQGGTGFSGRVIEYDGENWTTVLDHDYWVYSLEVYDDKLYAGTANKILTYNGTSWETSFNATEGAYYAISMIIYDGKIYVGMGNGYIFADPAPAKANPETIVVPEFSSNTILAVFMALTMLAAALTRKNRTRRFD